MNCRHNGKQESHQTNHYLDSLCRTRKIYILNNTEEYFVKLNSIKCTIHFFGSCSYGNIYRAQIEGGCGGMASPWSKKMTKSIPSVKPPFPLTIPFVLLILCIM